MIKKSALRHRSLAITAMANLLLFFSVTSAAQSLEDYPFAHVMYQSQQQMSDYLLALGELEKINSQWRAEREQRISGHLQRKTYALNDGHSAAEGFEFFHKQLLSKGARELFACEARRCGSSNSWANNVFAIKQLYGLDQHQRYSAFEWADASGITRYIALYAVTRGNKRSFVQLDVVTSRQNLQIVSSPELMLQRLQAGQSVLISGVTWQSGMPQFTDEQLQGLKKVLLLRPHWRFAVVGHDQQGRDIDQQLANSEAFAQALTSRLIALGIDAKRLRSFGVGGLAPNPLNSADTSYRLELLKIN